jgi:lysophospholipase L1-like esterase
MKNKILTVSLAVNLILISLIFFTIHKKGGISFLKSKVGIEQPPLYPPHYYERKSLFNLLPRDTSDIVFLGNSIVEGCEWSELFQNPKIKNRGIGQDDTKGVLNRIDEIIVSQPSRIFLMIGINDFSNGRKEKDILQNYVRILKTIKSKSPETKIYIQSLLPVDDLKNKSAKNSDIKSLNRGLVELSKRFETTYIDLYPLFINNGVVDSTMSSDGVHLLGPGYLKWKEAIIQYFK